MLQAESETVLDDLELDITDPFGEGVVVAVQQTTVPIPQPTPIPFGGPAGN